MCINASSIHGNVIENALALGCCPMLFSGFSSAHLTAVLLVCSISERDGTSRVYRSSGVSRVIHRIEAES
jgi:hypothetical protein